MAIAFCRFDECTQSRIFPLKAKNMHAAPKQLSMVNHFTKSLLRLQMMRNSTVSFASYCARHALARTTLKAGIQGKSLAMAHPMLLPFISSFVNNAVISRQCQRSVSNGTASTPETQNRLAGRGILFAIELSPSYCLTATATFRWSSPPDSSVPQVGWSLYSAPRFCKRQSSSSTNRPPSRAQASPLQKMACGNFAYTSQSIC